MTLSIKPREVIKNFDYIPVAERLKIEVFEFCRTGDLFALKQRFKVDQRILNYKTSEGDNLAVLALENSQFDTVLWLLEKKPELLKEENNNAETPCVYLYRKHFTVSLKWLLRSFPSILSYKGSQGNTLFLLACYYNDLPFAQFLYSMNSSVVVGVNNAQETALSLVFNWGEKGEEFLAWLVNEAKAVIASKHEVESLIKHAEVFNESCIHLLTEQSLPYFLPFLDQLKEKIKEESSLKHIRSFRNLFPETFFYDAADEELLKGEGIIEFYNRKIQDVRSVKDPYTKLNEIADSIKKTDYIAQMSLGSEKPVTEIEAETQQKKDKKLYEDFLEAIKLRKADRSIPLGKEEFYYRHLERILKHLTLFLSRVEDVNEKFTYLKVITECSGTCYTNYATALHSIYVGITGDKAVLEIHKTTDIAEGKFYKQLQNFYKLKIKGAASHLFQSQDAHVYAVMQGFFKDAHLPYPGVVAIDHQTQRFEALLEIRSGVLQDPVEDDSPFLYEGMEKFFYEDTQARMISLFTSKVLTIQFFYNTLEEFLLSNLNGENSHLFLSGFSSWLEENKISAHDVIVYEEGVYKLQSEGLCEILKKFTKEFIL